MSSSSRAEAFFAPCPRGLEALLADELRALGASDTRVTAGGVAFAGGWDVCYRANLWSRLASRILWRVAQFDYRSEDDVYAAARAVDWFSLFDVNRTLRVYVTAQKSPLKSLEFVTLRVKDAVCDRFRDDVGRRPDVERASPEVRVHVFLEEKRGALYLDTSGEALFKRGWRAAAGDAPLRENLAAGILRLIKWRPPTPLLDPMCGSGTFLVEAAMMALEVAPGLDRSFGFERLAGYDAGLWRTLREKARARRQPVDRLPIFGSDKSGTALAVARENLAAIGLAGAVELKQMDVLDGGPPAAGGILVMNPPYGERVGSAEELAAFYPRLGDALKQRYAGWTAYILTADLNLARLIGLKATKRTPLYNGALECRLFEYRLVAGSLRRTKPVTGGG